MIEKILRDAISQAHPQATIIGEEFEQTEGNGDLTFFLDPIDGTAAFVSGVPLYSTLLAIHDAHGPAVGVIHFPALRETVWAGRGRGCYFNDIPTQVNQQGDLSKSRMTASGYSDWDKNAFARLQDAGVTMRGWGDAYGHALVATGRVEAMVDFSSAHIWDFAPLVPILRESGGRFSDLDGNERLDSGSGISTNGYIHDELLKLLN